MTEKPLHVVSLQAENVKRLRAITINPSSNMVLIGGENAQGKTTTLDCIELALAGARAIPVEPVRRGERKARIVLDLGDIVVERTFSPKGTALEVRNAEGVPQKSPQALLDKLCAKVAFDPLGFAREEPKKQDEILKQVLGVDFSQLDAQRESLFTRRRDTKRDAKALEARVDAMVTHSGVPAEEVSVTDLTRELDRLRDKADENRIARESLAAAKNSVDWKDGELQLNADRIMNLKLELAQAEQERDRLIEAKATLEREAADAQLVVDAIVEPDTAGVRKQIADADETNRKVRENAERKRLTAQLKQLEETVESLTADIEEIDVSKAQRLSEAKFPVPGLGFDETGPTLNGIPLSQCSQAERLRVSVAIGAALNPRVKVMLVRDGSLLDDKSMALLAQLAQETDSQIWVERVSDRDESAVIIEDGLVVERAGSEAAQ